MVPADTYLQEHNELLCCQSLNQLAAWLYGVGVVAK